MIRAASVLVLSVLLIPGEVSLFVDNFVYTFIAKINLPPTIPFQFNKDDLYLIGIDRKYQR